ncbi:MAG: polysaccharide deacetylase family protein [Oscillospiraceae bacterium]|nr:polysaccharide deacetylase family protein [Oscillospiraceae bacterium]MDY4104566.1 polysaccharide deacetylase family protein [Oscillospiraceae bacterium]
MKKLSEFMSLHRKGLSVLGVTAAVCAMFYVINAPQIVGAAASERVLPIYCVERDNKTVALSFDAAWGNEDTQQLIDILNQYQVKATFFVVGDWVDRYPESVKALSDAGMEVMNHSDDHAHFSQLSEQQIVDNVNACADKIEAVTGTRPTLFRCPYGEYDDHVVSTINGMGIQVIQWDVEALAADGTPCTARGWAYGV